MKKGKSYHYEEIEIFANENEFDISEHGEEMVGKEFLCLEPQNGKDIVISFVLIGGNSNGFIYECIYTDL